MCIDNKRNLLSAQWQTECVFIQLITSEPSNKTWMSVTILVKTDLNDNLFWNIIEIVNSQIKKYHGPWWGVCILLKRRIMKQKCHL